MSQDLSPITCTSFHAVSPAPEVWMLFLSWRDFCCRIYHQPPVPVSVQCCQLQIPELRADTPAVIPVPARETTPLETRFPDTRLPPNAAAPHRAETPMALWVQLWATEAPTTQAMPHLRTGVSLLDTPTTRSICRTVNTHTTVKMLTIIRPIPHEYLQSGWTTASALPY